MIKLLLGCYCLLLILAGCKKVPNYPKAPQGESEEALLTRAKIHIMYTFNGLSETKLEDIYISNFKPSLRGDIVMYTSLDDVDKNYKLAIMDKTSTNAIVFSLAKNENAYWFWGPYSKDEWQLINGNWKWAGLVDIQELTRVGGRLLDN